jgi:hypothetical protein
VPALPFSAIRPINLSSNRERSVPRYMKCARAISRDRRQPLDTFIVLNYVSHAVDRPAGARGNVLVCNAAQRKSANDTALDLSRHRTKVPVQW